jgi:serine/threonine protein kinase
MRVGEQFEHYVVVEHIGRGGMADVWSARDERLHRTVAIKTIMADVSNEQTRVQFEHEARTIAALEHSNILPIYDFGEIERQLYIVMRYVAGGSLLDRIVEVGALSDAEALRVGEAISTALERAHAEKIVHRDLKPANVLLDRFGTPYLADFGLAAVVGAGDDDSLSSGTLIYMPPEQMFGQAVDHRSDIYAFAVMLFQMITGEFPFEGKAALCLKQVQEGEELPDPRRYRPDLSDQVANVLRIATAMDIEARFDSASELMSEVSAALQGQTLFSKEVGGRGVGPSQEPLPYHAETEVAVDD